MSNEAKTAALQYASGKKVLNLVQSSINRKLVLIILFATLFSLLMGAPISYIQAIIQESGILDIFGDRIEIFILNYFSQIVNLIVLITFFTIGMRRIVIRPVKKMVRSIDDMQKDGTIDLSEDIQVKSNDETGQMSNSLNNMVFNLREVVQTVALAAENVSQQTSEIAASTEEVSAASREVSESTQKLANDAEEGNKAVTEVSQALLELSSLIQIAQAKGTSADQNSDITLHSANEGKEVVHDVVTRMENIKVKTDETKQFISSLETYSKEITEITEMISNIAEQTNLLALNAAIEASRAGDAGKGFAVVADEVRKLAEQSTQGVNRVTSIVEKITETTSSTVTATDNNLTEVEEGVVEVKKAGEALDKILEAVNMTVKDIHEIVNVTQEEVATSEKIIALIDHLATFIENTSASAEEVSASMEETSATLDNIAGSTEKMNQLAADLKKAVTSFKL